MLAQALFCERKTPPSQGRRRLAHTREQVRSLHRDFLFDDHDRKSDHHDPCRRNHCIESGRAGCISAACRNCSRTGSGSNIICERSSYFSIAVNTAVCQAEKIRSGSERDHGYTIILNNGKEINTMFRYRSYIDRGILNVNACRDRVVRKQIFRLIQNRYV